MPGNRSSWKPEYRLGIGFIDEQHQQFFDFCDEIRAVCARAVGGGISVREVVRAIVKMRSYAFKHFHAEEMLMVKYDFPGLYAHCRLHDTFLRDLMGFSVELEVYAKEQDQVAREGFLDLAGRIADYTLDWWRTHIRETDTVYAGFIRRQGGVRA